MVGSVAGPAVWAQASDVDPAAVNALQRMTDFVGKLKGFRVHTESTLEYWTASGQRIDHDVAADVIVRRPNKIRAQRVGELVDQSFYYDGTTLTLDNPTDGVYATVPAPGTIEELLDFTRESLGLVIPIEDLVYSNAFAILTQGMTSAVVIGKSVIGGVTCEHLAISRPDVDLQVWVAEGDQPLPCKYVVTDTRTPPVSTVTVTSQWDLDPRTTDAEFTFVPSEAAQATTFITYDDVSAFGR
jgi:hypothetical protein